uniref:Uncharacterized protein LOC111107494 n=1 Tax=Crassostrea virginica TaxID=6565 RepID=A0A8B8B5H5_CRAVI|nr:uncharacterized protein LOC111107494 [Crassostrea virginica]
MNCVISVVLLLLTLLPTGICSGVRQLVECDVIIEQVPGESPLTVSYNSAQRTVCKRLIAVCSGEDCQMCAVVQTFRDPDCAVELKFKQHLFSRTDRTITCKAFNRVPFCRDQKLAVEVRMWKADAALDILFTARDKHKSTDVVRSNGVEGGMIGGIILITVVVLGLISLSCKRQGSLPDPPASPDTSSTAPLTHPSPARKESSFSLVPISVKRKPPKAPVPQDSSSAPSIRITTATPIKTALLEP